MCYQTIASPVSSTHRPKLESSPNYPRRLKLLQHQQQVPVTAGTGKAPRKLT